MADDIFKIFPIYLCYVTKFKSRIRIIRISNFGIQKNGSLCKFQGSWKDMACWRINTRRVCPLAKWRNAQTRLPDPDKPPNRQMDECTWRWANPMNETHQWWMYSEFVLLPERGNTIPVKLNEMKFFAF